MRKKFGISAVNVKRFMLDLYPAFFGDTVKLFVMKKFFSDKYKVRRLGRNFLLVAFLVVLIAIVGFLYRFGKFFSDFLFFVGLITYIIGLILMILSTDKNLFPNS
jgi:hypothetical protein